MTNRQLAIKILLLRNLRKRLRRKPRICNIRPIFFKRMESGESILVRELREDKFYHHKYFRMSRETFDVIYNSVEEHLSVGRKHCRPISKLEKLALTLRFLATGNSQVSMSMSYRISPSAIGKLLRETMEVLCKVLEPDCLPTPTEQGWKRIESEFATEWNFPNCCGAIDGKHVRVRAPSLTGSLNYNYKGFFSIVLMAVVDAKYKFILVDIGASGSQSDGGVLLRSAIGKAIESKTLNLPEDKMVGDVQLPYVFVGDDAFPLKTNLMKPYPGRGLTHQRRIFNYRMSRARLVSENAFGILAARWRILHTAIMGDIEFTKLIIKTCVILHNFLMQKKDMSTLTVDCSSEDRMLPGNWRNAGEMQDISPQGSNNHTISASEVRDGFMNYFNGCGAVSWQNERI